MQSVTNLKQLYCRSTLVSLMRCSKIEDLVNVENMSSQDDIEALINFLKIIFNEALKIKATSGGTKSLEEVKLVIGQLHSIKEVRPFFEKLLWNLIKS